ncbi:MAG: glycogen/starch synthase, partial [Caldisericia bacterium]
MKILFVASEAAPFVKTGGLGDVLGSLPKYLKKLNLDVSLILPLYQKIKEKNIDLEFIDEIDIKKDEEVFKFKLYKNKSSFDFD